MESSQWQNGNYSTGCVMLGTCFVIDYVPVKSEILINERKKKMKVILAQETVFW